ncbi:mitochondrial transcription rescue factor 1 [Lasioglossum baleicum]|uniref:mitochondrial transcription rescue factor 1 n=1 Tax=Lasioglossum baleicum TaxID=434251 RepID=UPI003FCD2B1D
MMSWRTTLNLVRHSVYKNKRIIHTFETAPISSCQQYKLRPTYSCLQPSLNSITQKRFKSKKQVSSREEESSDDEEDSTEIDDYLQTQGAKVVNTSVSSLRLDAVAKAAFGMSRNKIDKAFYNSNLRVNGEKCLKKSETIAVEDEIDLVIGRSNSNPAFITVHRCILMSIKPAEESIEIKLIRNKNLLIEDYDDPWNGVIE